DAGVGHIEGRPGMQKRRHMGTEIEEKKIDNVTVEKTIRQISENAGQQQRQQSGRARNRDKKRIVILERTESGTGVGDVYQMKKAGAARWPWRVRINVINNQILCSS